MDLSNLLILLVNGVLPNSQRVGPDPRAAYMLGVLHQSMEALPQVFANGVWDSMNYDLLRIFRSTLHIRDRIVLGQFGQVNNTESPSEGSVELHIVELEQPDLVGG